MRGTIGPLQRLFRSRTVSGLSEGALLDRFLTEREPDAFQAILVRHGPMVLTVCRRFLRDQADVEDAFQATFLVLVRKAAGLRDRHALAPWLYGVALKVAARARQQSLTRGKPAMPDPPDHHAEAASAALERAEDHAALHEELARLPENYRAPIVLCHLEGLTHDDAAQRLNWPVGTVRGRLARGREKLRERLARRGVGAPAEFTVPGARASGLTIPLMNAVTSAAVRVVAGESLRTVGPPAVAALAQGVLSMVSWSPFKLPAVLLSTMVVGLGVTLAGQGDPARPESPFAAPRQQLKKQATPDRRQVTAIDFDPELQEVPEGTLPKVPYIEDTTEAIRKAQSAYDADRAELERATAAFRAEMEYLDAVTKAHSEGVIRNVEARLKTEDELRRSEELESLRLEKVLDLQRGNIERHKRELREHLEQAATVRYRLEDAEKRLEEHKRRPRPLERVEVRPGDFIRVEVLEALPGRPLSGERYVGPTGKISLEFYGDLYVAGMTTDEIKEKAILRLRKFLPDPTLGLIEINSETGKPIIIPPRESDRVFVELMPSREVYEARSPRGGQGASR